MKSIKISDLDELYIIMNGYVPKLRYEGYHSGKTYFRDNITETAIHSLTEWWVKHLTQVRKGGSFIVAEVLERVNPNNYTWAGEYLELVSTPLRSGNILIELILYGIEENSYGFYFNDNGTVEEVFMCKTKHMK